LGFKQIGAVIRIQFNHASQLKTADGLPLHEFEIENKYGIFEPVNASVVGKEVIIQTQIKNVQKIRYGWNPFSRGNLVNEAGLPASTFEMELKYFN